MAKNEFLSNKIVLKQKKENKWWLTTTLKIEIDIFVLMPIWGIFGEFQNVL